MPCAVILISEGGKLIHDIWDQFYIIASSLLILFIPKGSPLHLFHHTRKQSIMNFDIILYFLLQIEFCLINRNLLTSGLFLCSVICSWRYQWYFFLCWVCFPKVWKLLPRSGQIKLSEFLSQFYWFLDDTFCLIIPSNLKWVGIFKMFAANKLLF